MTSKRDVRTGPQRPVRTFQMFGRGVAALALATAIPVAPAAAQSTLPASVAATQGISDFYSARSNRPLWFSQNGRQAALLLETLKTADLDGFDPDRYRIDAIEKALDAAERSGSSRAVRKADILLSRAFVDYVRDLRTPGQSSTIYVDSDLKPSPPSGRAALDAAARAPSLERYVAEMRWMNPLYGQLRQALASGSYSPEQRDLIRLNLLRTRELPAGSGRYVLVNAAAQRLFMYENGEAVDSMRVVVGKPIYPTPIMAAYIRFANLNPYWYVPADLAAERIAPNVLKQGLPYLDRQGYQVVSDFIGEPKIFDPSTIDWQAVADGRQKVLIRQLPGPHNSMGRIKFMFPNSEGVYLHDNPERELFEQAARLYSGGCVRLEAAWRLSRWLFGRDLTWKGAATEQEVPLEKPVPVYISYLTAVPDGSQIAFLDDVYGRDKARLARQSDGGLLTTAR
ncbi:MAG: L,D-transpeptidase family protein [Sphingomonas sp.]|nr:L,D-transpeptidase family protein [Sphingomonas sp.]